MYLSRVPDIAAVATCGVGMRFKFNGLNATCYLENADHAKSLGTILNL